MFLAARISPLLMQRMHGGYVLICCEIGSRASEAAQIMTEWRCIDEREWMERRTKGKEQGSKAKRRTGGRGGGSEKFLETLQVREWRTVHGC